MQQGADRGGIGWRDRGAGQHGHDERDAREPCDRSTNDNSRDSHADKGQDQRRPDGHPQHCDGRPDAAIEQDHGEGYAADQVG